MSFRLIVTECSLLVVILLANVHCHQSKFSLKTYRDFKIVREDILKLKTQYLYLNSQNRSLKKNTWENPDYGPEMLLQRIHPWFKVGIGLIKDSRKFNGHELYYLNLIPDYVLKSLDEGLLQEPFSFSILTTSFWRRVAEAQVEGVTVTFTKYFQVNETVLLGFAIRDQNLIVLTTLVDRAILEHELQHLKQSTLTQSGLPKNLANLEAEFDVNCLNSLANTIGELDATEKSLKFYTTIINEFDFNFLLQSREINSDLPQHSLFSSGVTYHIDQVDKIRNSSCKFSTIEIFEHISGELEQANQLSENIFVEISASINGARRLASFLSERCNDEVKSPECKTRQIEIEQNKKRFNLAKESFPEKFQKTRQLWKQILNERLTQLAKTPEEKELFCKRLSGYRFLVDCGNN